MLKRVAIFAAGAICSSFLAFGASAATIPASSMTTVSDAQLVQYGHGHQAAKRHHHAAKRHCVMKRVKVRGHHGRPAFKTVRVCR